MLLMLASWLALGILKALMPRSELQHTLDDMHFSSQDLQERGHRPRSGTREPRPSQKTHTASKKGCNGSQDLQERGHTVQEVVQRESRPSQKRTHHPRRGRMGAKTFKNEDTPSKKWYKGSQDPREGGHTIQKEVRRESRKVHWELRGQTRHPRRGTRESRPGHAIQRVKKAHWESRPSRRRTHRPRTGTKGAKKTPGKADTPSRRHTKQVKTFRTGGKGVA